MQICMSISTQTLVSQMPSNLPSRFIPDASITQGLAETV